MDYDYKNYIPTFQVEFCELAKVLVILKEYDRDKLVWQRPIKLSGMSVYTMYSLCTMNTIPLSLFWNINTLVWSCTVCVDNAIVNVSHKVQC